ncbi:hypothetical protein BDA96_02G121500 [Sorghum bicolor]|uniref:DUF1618 domain-containing protein n=1 Tax=Sorghum bicolor TaxID=4558 RepID=A0A921RLQ0_SORBI|nr:hypothetical protein BDA96_02G121500 [Sorghum bicolor]
MGSADCRDLAPPCLMLKRRQAAIHATEHELALVRPRAVFHFVFLPSTLFPMTRTQGDFVGAAAIWSSELALLDAECCRSPSSSSPAYLLAELATTPHRRFPNPDAVLLLWRSDEQEQPTPPQWVTKEVHLPREVCWAPDKHMFQGDTSFAGPDGCLCWVDLLHGIVVCTNPHQDPPVLRFIPLPDGCPAFGWSDYPYRPRMEESRSAACVGGRIKVVSMVGLLEGWNSQQFRLTTWTLSSSASRPDVLGGEWQEDGVCPLEDLWATEEYRALNLPPRTPLCPVLSAAGDEEDSVVYAVVNDIEERVVVQGRLQQIVWGTELKLKRQYVLGIDLRRNKIVSTSSSVPPESLMQMTPCLLPFDLCASLNALPA